MEEEDWLCLITMPHHQEVGDEGNAKVPATHDADLVRSLQDISQQMNELRLNLFDRGRPVQQDRAQGRGGARGRAVFGRCYNCAEEGHYAPSAHIPQGKGEVSILFMAVVVEMRSMPHKMRGRFNNQLILL